MIRYLAVYTGRGSAAGGQGYILDVYDDDEMRRYRRELKWMVVSEHDGPREAWAAVKRAMEADTAQEG